MTQESEQTSQPKQHPNGLVWCNHHMGFSPMKGGRFIVGRRNRRWICAECLVKKRTHEATLKKPK